MANPNLTSDFSANKSTKQHKRQALTHAAHWYTLFCADDYNLQDTLAWQAWLNGESAMHLLNSQAVGEHTQHRLNTSTTINTQEQALLNQWAWQQLEKLQTNLQKMPSHIAVDSLVNLEPKINQQRRMAMRSLMLIMGTGSLGWLGYRSGLDNVIDLAMAGHSSQTGEISTLNLPDGTQVILNTASAIDVEFSATERLIVLRHGEIMVQTAKTAEHREQTRPFIVQTEHGRIQALGTRFSVREFSDKIRVNVYQHSVRVTTNTGEQQLCPIGHSVNFTAQHVFEPINDTDNDSWTTQMLSVNDMPLTEFVNEVSRYRIGVVRCHASLAKYHISGAFNTGDTEQIFRAIEKSFPIKINRYSRYWLSITSI